MKYYYAVKDGWKGPVTLEELKILASRNKLKKSDLVWTEGMVAWQRADLTPAIVEGLPPDLETDNQVTSPPPLPADAQSSGSAARAKPLSPGLIIGLIILVGIVIMVIISQTEKTTHDHDFDLITGAAQEAGQSQSDVDPRNITPP